MASIQTAQGTITVRSASEVAAMLDAGLINVSQAGQLQVALAGGGEIVAPPSPGINQNLALRQTVPTSELQPPTGTSNTLPNFQAAPFTAPPPTTGGGATGGGGFTSFAEQFGNLPLPTNLVGDKTVQDILAEISSLGAGFVAADLPTKEAIVAQVGLLLEQAKILANVTQFDTTTKNALEIARKDQETKRKEVDNLLEQQDIISEGRIEEERIRAEGGLAGIQAQQQGQNVTQQTANQGLLNVAQQQGMSALDLQALLNQGNLGVQGLQNTGDLNLQSLLNQGNLGVVGAQGTNQLLLQQLLNAGNLGLQGLQNTGDLALQQLLSQGNLASQGLQNQGQLSLQQLLNQGNLAGIQAQGTTAVDIANIQAAIDQASISNSNAQFQQNLALQSQLGLGGLGIQQGRLQLDQQLGLGGLGIDQNRLLLDQLLGTGQLDLGRGQLDLNRLLGVGGLGFDFSQLAQQQAQFGVGIEQQMAQRAEESRQFDLQNQRLLEAAQLQLRGQLAGASATTGAANIRAGSEQAQLAELARQFGITQPEDVRQFDVGTQTSLTALLSNQQNQAIANPFGAFALNLLGGNALALPQVSPGGQSQPLGVPALDGSAVGVGFGGNTDTNVNALLDPNRSRRKNPALIGTTV